MCIRDSQYNVVHFSSQVEDCYITLPDGTNWPKNFGQSRPTDSGTTLIDKAVQQSMNTVAARLAQQLSLIHICVGDGDPAAFRRGGEQAGHGTAVHLGRDQTVSGDDAVDHGEEDGDQPVIHLPDEAGDAVHVPEHVAHGAQAVGESAHVLEGLRLSLIHIYIRPLIFGQAANDVIDIAVDRGAGAGCCAHDDSSSNRRVTSAAICVH